MNQEVRDHFYFNGVDQSYINWIFHGETIYNISPTCLNEKESKTYDVFDGFDETIEMVQAVYDCFVGDSKKLDPLFEVAKKPLYNGFTTYLIDCLFHK